MLADKFAAYGSASSSRLSDKMGKAKKKPANLGVLAGCLVAPLLLFVLVFWLRSFDLRSESEDFSTLVCYLLFCLPVLLFVSAFSQAKLGEDSKPMLLLAGMCLVAVLVGYSLGDCNYRANMQPFYDIGQMNTYPNVDPSKYGGQQLMDAGQIDFVKGSTVLTRKSMGFKDGDVYCVAPIAGPTTSGNSSAAATQSKFDFWAVGINCCSGHQPDYHCGEYNNPSARKGLRVMDSDKKDMFRLVVQKAEAEFNLAAPHPIFLYWLADASSEVSAYRDDGWRNFVTATFGFFCGQVLVVVGAVLLFVVM